MQEAQMTQQKQDISFHDTRDYDSDSTAPPVPQPQPESPPESASSSASLAVSPGKRPLSQQQLRALFSSSESKQSNADLSMIYASADSIFSKSSLEFWRNNDISNLFTSNDEMPPLRAPVEGDTKPFASIDAAESLVASTDPEASVPQDPAYASIDPLPLEKGDEKPGANEDDGQVGIYESREWLNEYTGNHTDVAYGKDMFKEPATQRRSRWESEYLAGLRMPDSVSESQTVKPQSHHEETPKKTTSTNTASAAKRREPKEKIYVKPLHADILSGRGGKTNSWPGNERYREVIEELKPAYRAGAKFEKTIKSQEVVEILLEEGRRFLKLEEDGPRKGDYYIMTKNEARRKAGQALREENTPESRKRKREFYASRNKKRRA